MGDSKPAATGTGKCGNGSASNDDDDDDDANVGNKKKVKCCLQRNNGCSPK
jgi:hypothetical protein